MKHCLFCDKVLDESEEVEHLKRNNGTHLNPVCKKHEQFAYSYQVDLVREALKKDPEVVTSAQVIKTLYPDKFNPVT